MVKDMFLFKSKLDTRTAHNKFNLAWGLNPQLIDHEQNLSWSCGSGLLRHHWPQLYHCVLTLKINIFIGYPCCIVPETVPGEFLVFVDPYHKQLYQVSADGQGNPVHGLMSSTLMAYPVSVDYSPTEGKLYWIDQGLGVIGETSMDPGIEDRILLRYGEGKSRMNN